ncbi:MAG: hypothetical protein N2234_05175 [Planctomycetota bacterium]|nr:hypothetical protein [Planctomycetota bacterium]
MIRFVLACFAIVWFLCFWGCMPGEYYKPEGYSEQKQPQFDDIPLPERYFTYLEGDSFTYVCPSVPSFRVARMRLVGDARLDNTVDFYKERMPRLDWEPYKWEEVSKVEDRVELKFRKKDFPEICTIELWREGEQVYLEIRVGVLRE